MSWHLRKLMARGGYMSAENGDGGNNGGAGAGADAGAGAGGGGAGGAGGAAGGAGEGGAGEGGEGDGGKKPTDEEARLLKEVMDKKNKLKDAQSRIGQLEVELKKFDGIDLDAMKALLQEQKNSETKKLEEKGEWDRLKAQMNDEHGKQLDLLKNDAEDAKGEVAKLKDVIAELTVGNSFSSSQFIKDELTMPVSKTRVLYGPHFEFVDGNVVAYDKPVGGKDRTMLVDAKGDPLGFDAALKKIVDADPDRDQLLKSKMKPGAGSTTSSKSAAPAQKMEEPRGISRISDALGKGALAKK